MRLVSLEIAGFRGFTAPAHFDLDADAVVIVGNNGQGKTSLFDAILWCITGSVARVGEDSSLVSVYSRSGEIRVELTVKDDEGVRHSFIRSYNGSSQVLSIETEGRESLRGDAARLGLLRLLWPEALSAANGITALGNAFTRSVYLQQDLVRQFIDADGDQERFTIVSELVGSGRVTELQANLDRARSNWTRSITESRRELEALQNRHTELQTRLNEIRLRGNDEHGGFERQWLDWWSSAQGIGDTPLEYPNPESVEAPQTLDRALRQMAGSRRSLQRRADEFLELLAEIQTPTNSGLTDLSPFSSAISTLRGEVAQTEASLERLQSAAATERTEQLRLRNAREDLRVLATLALRHLGETCPVCGQEYDHDSTIRRLSEMAEGGDAPQADSFADEIARLSTTLEERRQSLMDLESEFRVAERVNAEVERTERAFRRRLEELGINSSPGELPDILNHQLQETEALIDLTSQQIESGENLSLALSTARERARQGDLEREYADVHADLTQLQNEIEARERTGRIASLILDALREASIEIVEARVSRLVPLFQRIYSRIDPHPAFRAVDLLTRISRGRGRLSPSLQDHVANVSSSEPSTLLSSSQTNALAVSIFLALNLAVKELPVQAVILDDPLQSLDDVNLLGTIDLLRRTAGLRQLVVSTHDARFASLLERKLRPVDNERRTTIIRLDGWSREGPSIEQSDVPRDTNPLKLVV